jgi:hypothetical protein
VPPCATLESIRLDLSLLPTRLWPQRSLAVQIGFQEILQSLEMTDSNRLGTCIRRPCVLDSTQALALGEEAGLDPFDYILSSEALSYR